MVAPAVQGIDLFKIAGRSISGWIPSLKTAAPTPVRQPFCSQLEERLLMWLEYHPQVAWYVRGDIDTQFAKVYRLPTSDPARSPLATNFSVNPITTCPTRAVHGWLEPWIMLRRYWNGWSQLPHLLRCSSSSVGLNGDTPSPSTVQLDPKSTKYRYFAFHDSLRDTRPGCDWELVRNVQYNSPTPMTTLAEFVSLSCFTQRELRCNGDFDLSLIDQLSERMQEFARGTS